MGTMENNDGARERVVAEEKIVEIGRGQYLKVWAQKQNKYRG